MRYKSANGIQEALASCHTGRIDGHVIEGHVPGSDILRLLHGRPDAGGIAVPGIPYGSPGIGPENEREAYDVFLIRRKGVVEPFQVTKPDPTLRAFRYFFPTPAAPLRWRRRLIAFGCKSACSGTMGLLIGANQPLRITAFKMPNPFQ